MHDIADGTLVKVHDPVNFGCLAHCTAEDLAIFFNTQDENVHFFANAIADTAFGDAVTQVPDVLGPLDLFLFVHLA